MFIVRVVRSTGDTLAEVTCKGADNAVKQMLLQYHAIRAAAKLPFEPISEDLMQASLELLPRGESVTWATAGAHIHAGVADIAEFTKLEGKRKFVAAKKAVSRLN
jgi:hypothetical protein